MMADVKNRWTCPKCGGHVAVRIRDSPMYLGEFVVMCANCSSFIAHEKEAGEDNLHVRKISIGQCFDR